MALTSSNNHHQESDWGPLLSLAHIAVSYLGRDNIGELSKNDFMRSRMVSVDENISRPSSSSPPNSNSISRGESPSFIAKTLSDGRSRKRLLDRFLESSGGGGNNDSVGLPNLKSSRTLNNDQQHQFTCEVCNKCYSTASNLSRHKQIHLAGETGETLSCDKCGKTYVSSAALTMHQMTHDMSNECVLCGKKFSRLWLLQGHLRCHTQEKPFCCEICGKSFADRSNLRVHTRLHEPKKSHSCPRCSRPFALKSYVTKHLETCKATSINNDNDNTE